MKKNAKAAEKKLSLERVTLKNLSVRTGVRTGDPCDTAKTCTIDCYKSCDAGATLCSKITKE